MGEVECRLLERQNATDKGRKEYYRRENATR